MIITFEEYTSDLSKDEEAMALQMANIIKNKYIGKQKAVTSTYIINSYKKRGVLLTAARVRKFVNFARHKGFPIVACTKGYFYPKTQEEYETYLTSLGQRISEIIRVYNAIGRLGIQDFKPVKITQ